MFSRSNHVACRPFLMCALALQCIFAQSAPGQVDYFPDIPTGSQRVSFEIVTALNGAMDLQEFPDGSGRLLTNRAFNRLYRIQPSGENFVFLRACPCDVAETEGMTSLAFHPGFADVNGSGYGKFYTVTADKSATFPPDFAPPGDEPALHQHVLTEWTMNNITNSAFVGSHRELMRVEKKNSVHGVNDLAFGPDGYLYIGIGEDENDILAGSTDNVFGKILRIDPLGNNSANGQYGIPADNPFVGEPGSAGEIYAYGLRNPWRIWFDRVTGDLFTGDVGWNSIEEVDRIVSGGNYGWPTKEGSLLAAREAIPDLPDPITGLTKAEELGLIEPLFEYDHTDGNSVLGGVVYRGSDLPWLYGKVIFGDWDVGRIMAGDPETGEFIEFPFADGEVLDALGGERFTSINEDLEGELYLLGGLQIVRITPLASDINLDGTVDGDDVDSLVSEIVAGTNDPAFDLTADGAVDNADLNQWLNDAATANGFSAPYLLGDANLDGTVNASDLNALGQHWLDSPNTWQMGNFTADGTVDANDLNELGQNWQQSIPEAASQTSAVPEPATATLAIFALAAVTYVRRRT